MEKCKNTCKPCATCNITTAPVIDETQRYYEGLKLENEQLRRQLEVVEEDRDQSKQDAMRYAAKFLELYAQINGLKVEDLTKEIGEEMHKTLER